MPRYLGINYWQSMIEQRREFYSRALLLVPHHLHQEDSAKRFKTDQQELHEDQWKICKETGPFEDVIVAERLDILGQLKDVSGSISEADGRSPEMYDRRTEFHLIDDHVVETVPSSNPESIDSFLSDELFEPFDTLDDTMEVFEKEDLSEYGDEKEKDKLEDVLLSDGLKDTCSNFPKLSTLIHCLQSRSVKDPLADEEGTTYSEVLVFKEHFKMEGEEASVRQPTKEMTVHLEAFEKCTFSDHKTWELEDVILPPCKKGEEDRVNSMLDIRSHVKTCVSREAEEWCEDKNDDWHLVPESFISVAEVEEPEITGISSSSGVDFLTLNDPAVESKDGKLESRALLESPILPCKSPETHTWNLTDQLQELKPTSTGINTTQFVFTIKQSKGDNPSLCFFLGRPCFLRQFEKEAILTKVWEHEKFFDEVLALRLSEPVVAEEHFPGHTSVPDLMSQFQLVEESGLGSVELQLQWDPWLSCRALMTRALQVEQADFGVGTMATSVLSVDEVFVKYTLNELYVDVDSDADIQTVTLQQETGTTHTQALKAPRRTGGKSVKDKMEELSTTRAEGISLSKDNLPTIMDKIPRSVVTDDGSFTGFSPLDEFFMMRTSTITKHFENKQTDKASVTKQSHEYHKDIVQSVEETVPQTAPQTSLCKTVDVQLSGPHKQVFHALHSFALPYINVLKQAGEIPHHASMLSLKLDLTRFLVKEKEKEQQDRQTDSGDVYKSAVVVYAVVGAVDLLVHCCLESAISHFSAVHEKYHTTLGGRGCLESIRKELFQFKVSFDQNNVLHPKVGILCKNIEETVKSSTGNGKGNKVLVVTKRNLPSLMCYLEKALSVCADICTYFTKTLEEDTFSEAENHNCVIVNESASKKHTKLDMFGLVIEFETESNSSTCRICQDIGVNYLGLKGNMQDMKKEETQEVHSLQMKKSDIKVTVIGSVNLTSQKNVLQLLESRHNIAVIERDNTDNDSRPCVDVIVDERHCVVLHSLRDITDEGQVENLSRKLVVLGLQFTYCWVIFYSTDSKSKGYLLPNAVVANICKLEAVLANLNSNTDRFQIKYKLLIAYNLEQLAATVRLCCDKCVEVSTVWTKHQWTRPWISGDASREEKFLTILTCLNSFSAQLLLSRRSLVSLLSCTLPQLQQIAPELPEKVHLMFYKMINCDTGLHLRSDDTVKVDLELMTRPTMVPNRQTEYNCLDSTAHGHQGSNMTSRNGCYQNLNDIQIPRFSDDFLQRQPKSKGCSTQSQSMHRTQQNGFTEDPDVRLVDQCPRQSFLSQYTNESPGNSQGYTKPNEYVLAKIKGMDEDESRQSEETVTPDFDLLGVADIQRLTGRPSEELNVINQASLPNVFRPEKMQSTADMYVHGDQDIVSGCTTVANKKPSFSSVLHEKMNSKNRFLHEFRQSNPFDGVDQNQQCPSTTLVSESHGSGYFPEKSIEEGYLGPGWVDSQLDIPKMHELPRPDAGVIHSYVDLGRSMLPRCHERRPPLHSSNNGRWPDLTNRSSSMKKSLLGQPAFSENFQSSLLKPPVQRVSIGLAQPLRRDTQQEQIQRAAQPATRWMNYDSPPMDMEPDSPYHGANTHKEQPYAYRHQKQQEPYRMFQADKEQGDDVSYLFEDFPNKRKKLTYKPLPGRSRGQTVLAFR